MTDSTHYDLIVIGGGPAGYVGAIRAAQLGMKTACIERDALGGVCLNWGCIPSKALLHNADLYREAVVHGADWGLRCTGTEVDWEKIIGRSRAITGTLSSGITGLFKKNGIEHIVGHAAILPSPTGEGAGTIEVRQATGSYYTGEGGEVQGVLQADRILICTGAAPRELPGAARDGSRIINSADAMTLPSRPARMVIVGSGAIGMEFAYFYAAFGTEVHVIEMEDRILPAEDRDVSRIAQRVFTRQGITFHLGQTVSTVECRDDDVLVSITGSEDSAETLETDVVLVAIGVQARIDGLFPGDLKPGLVSGFLETDARAAAEPTYQTTLPGIHAVGDVIGPPWLAHVASEEAVTAVERMAGQTTIGIDYDSIPGCTYCNPQVASIGMTEDQLQSDGVEYSAGTCQFRGHGKAIAVGATDGFVKLLVSRPYGEILGCHIFGKDASEMISEICIAKRLEATVEDIISTMHAHPTMHEAIHEAALGAEGRMIHG